jgi:hypothetical protein
MHAARSRERPKKPSTFKTERFGEGGLEAN